MTSIGNILEQWVGEHPDKRLFTFLDVKGEETEKYSFAEFHHRTGVIASNLHYSYSLKPGDRVLPAWLDSGGDFLAASVPRYGLDRLLPLYVGQGGVYVRLLAHRLYQAAGALA
jgi:hypothetical protein